MISTMGFGRSSVKGRRRSPFPPASTTAYLQPNLRARRLPFLVRPRGDASDPELLDGIVRAAPCIGYAAAPALSFVTPRSMTAGGHGMRGNLWRAAKCRIRDHYAPPPARFSGRR